MLRATSTSVRHLDFLEASSRCAKKPSRVCFLGSVDFLLPDVAPKDGGYIDAWVDLILAAARDKDSARVDSYSRRLIAVDERFASIGKAASAVGRQDKLQIAASIATLDQLDTFNRLQVIDVLSRASSVERNSMKAMFAKLKPLLSIEHGHGDFATKAYIRMMPALLANGLGNEVSNLNDSLSPLRWIEAQVAYIAARQESDLVEPFLRKLDEMEAANGSVGRAELVRKETTMARAKLAVAFPNKLVIFEVLERLRTLPNRDEAAVAMAGIAISTKNVELYQEALRLARKAGFFDYALADVGFLAQDQFPLEEAVNVSIKNVKVNPRDAAPYAVKFFAHCAEKMWH